MKILHIAYGHRHDDIRIYEKECKSLLKLGHKVYYVTSNKLSDPSQVPRDSMVKIKIINLRNCGRWTRVAFYILDVLNYVEKLKPDVCHLHDIHLLPMVWTLSKKCKVIFDSHEDYSADLAENLFKNVPLSYRVKEKSIELIERFAFFKVDYVIAATPYLKRKIKKICKNVGCVCNFPILSNESNKIGDYMDRENNICYVGGLTEKRGITNVIRAIEGLDITLYLSGDITDSYKEELKKEPGWKNVKYLGFLPRTKVQKVYGKCIAGIALLKPTSNSVNSLAIKLFEYMDAGLPVICSDFPVWRKTVESNGCGVCGNPEDIEEIRKIFKMLLENRESFYKFGEKGILLTKEKFNWQMEEKKLFSYYRKIQKGSDL